MNRQIFVAVVRPSGVVACLFAVSGRVVIVDFWTFGCNNCRHTLPTLKRWDARYRERELAIIGVHTPESDYERDVDNVAAPCASRATG